MFISIVGVIISIGFLIYMMYKNVSPLLSVPIATLIVAVFANVNVYQAMTDGFLSGWSGMIVGVGWTFLGSTVFGEVMSRAGASEAIAYWFVDHFDSRKATWIIFLTSALLSYSGMSFGGYIVIYPIALILCKEADYNKGIIMAAVLGGAWTFSMVGPWSPTVGNTVPQTILGTNSSAGLIPGLAASVVMFVAIGFYLDWQVRTWQKAGRRFDSHEEVKKYEKPREDLPNIVLSLLPAIGSIVLFNVFNCNLGVSLMLASFLGVAFMWKRYSPKEWLTILSDGARASALPILNLSIFGGLSAALSSTPVFEALSSWAVTTTASPYLVVAIIASIFSIIMSSSSTSVNMLVASMPDVLTSYVNRGFNAGFIHRMIAMGSGGPSIMPFGGSMATMNTLFNTNFRESYSAVFWSCAVIPTVCAYAICLPLCLLLS